jgi:hypothetical protein
MSEETDGTIAGAEAETSQVENTSEATTEQPTGAEDAGQADDAGEATEEAHQKRVPWFQKRIDEVTRQKYDAQREADYWRGLAEGRVQPQQQTAQQVPDRWEDPEGYDRYLIQQAVDLAKQQTTAELRQQQQARTYEEREASIRQSKPDYDSVVRDPTLPITPLMAEVIRETERGPEIAYYLGTNREEAQRIAGLPPHLQAASLGRIEASFVAPPRAQPRNVPPPPPQTVAGISAGIGKSPDDMSMAEYVAWMKERDKT